MFEGFSSQAVEYFPILLQGVGTTVAITLCTLVMGTTLGLFWAMLRVSGIKVLAQISRYTTNIIRGIPIIVILFYLYFVVPEFGVDLTAFQAGFIGLGLTYSAYMSEVFRAGIEAIDPGQNEAAHSIGMSRAMSMRRVILPQAWKIALPPYSNNMIMMLKDTSQTSIITVVELSMQGKLLAAASFNNANIFTLVALMYLSLSLPLMAVAGWLERKFKRSAR